jgi:2-keto-4-pentenoate hydratase
MQDADYIGRLVTAQRDAVSTVDPQPFSQLDREAAYRVQTGVVTALGASVGMLKTAVHADGVGVVAPIFADKVGRAPSFRLASQTVAGLEVEVCVVLARDVPPRADAAAVLAAVDHYFLGVEICATRYTDRKAAGPMGGLADNMSGYGYAIGPKRARGAGAEIDGLEVGLVFGGKQIHAAPAKHAFGTVMASVVAYAASQHPAYPLKAGTIITTGSMCGLVPASGPGHVVASLGDETLEFDLV